MTTTFYATGIKAIYVGEGFVVEYDHDLTEKTFLPDTILVTVHGKPKNIPYYSSRPVVAGQPIKLAPWHERKADATYPTSWQLPEELEKWVKFVQQVIGEQGLCEILTT